MTYAVLAVWPMEAWLDDELAGISFVAAYEEKEKADDLVKRLEKTKGDFGDKPSRRLKGEEWTNAIKKFHRKEDRVSRKLGLPKHWCADMEYIVLESCAQEFRGFQIP